MRVVDLLTIINPFIYVHFSSMEQTSTSKEIDDVVNNITLDNAPGPYGFNGENL